MEYSSGMLSCCCRSRHTNVLGRLGSLVVSVINNCRSVANCFSVSLTAFPRSQLFCSIASTLGACPIFIWWTRFTPTYLAQLIARTSSIDGSCSDPDPISPSSIGVHCCFPGGGVLSFVFEVCGRCGRSVSQKGSTVHCSILLSCGWKPSGWFESLFCRLLIAIWSCSSMIFLSFRINLGSWYYFQQPPDILYTPGLTISLHGAMRFLVSAEGSVRSRLSMVCASIIDFELSNAEYAQLSVGQLRQVMAVCSRVLDFFGLLHKFSRCDWSIWLLRQPNLFIKLRCGAMLLITYSSYASSAACGGAVGFLLR